jgi:hypothetical protein
MAYLGRRYNRKNLRSWRRAREGYATVLHYLPGSRRVWTTCDELDGLDRQRSLTLEEVRRPPAQATGEQTGGSRGRRGGILLLKLQRGIFPGMGKQGKRT